VAQLKVASQQTHGSLLSRTVVLCHGYRLGTRGAIHFGRGTLPWAHATRLEQIGGIEVIAIVDPDTKLAESVLKTRLSYINQLR
jgi:hypothetical protein